MSISFSPDMTTVSENGVAVAEHKNMTSEQTKLFDDIRNNRVEDVRSTVAASPQLLSTKYVSRCNCPDCEHVTIVNVSKTLSSCDWPMIEAVLPSLSREQIHEIIYEMFSRIGSLHPLSDYDNRWMSSPRVTPLSTPQGYDIHLTRVIGWMSIHRRNDLVGMNLMKCVGGYDDVSKSLLHTMLKFVISDEDLMILSDYYAEGEDRVLADTIRAKLLREWHHEEGNFIHWMWTKKDMRILYMLRGLGFDVTSDITPLIRNIIRFYHFSDGTSYAVTYMMNVLHEWWHFERINLENKFQAAEKLRREEHNRVCEETKNWEPFDYKKFHLPSDWCPSRIADWRDANGASLTNYLRMYFPDCIEMFEGIVTLPPFVENVKCAIVDEFYRPLPIDYEKSHPVFRMLTEHGFSKTKRGRNALIARLREYLPSVPDVKKMRFVPVDGCRIHERLHNFSFVLREVNLEEELPQFYDEDSSY